MCNSIRRLSLSLLSMKIVLVITFWGRRLSDCIFENFEIARVNREQFQCFQKSREWFDPLNHVNQTCD